MAANESVLNNLKQLLADKDRQISDLTNIVAQLSDALSNYFKTRCHECDEEMGREDIICADCHDPEPCIRLHKLATGNGPKPGPPTVVVPPPLPTVSVPPSYVPASGLPVPVKTSVSSVIDVKRMPDGYFKESVHDLCIRPAKMPLETQFVAVGYYVGDVIQPLTQGLQQYCEFKRMNYCPLDSYTILPSLVKEDLSPIKVSDLKPLEIPCLPSVSPSVPKLSSTKTPSSGTSTNDVPELPKNVVPEKMFVKKGSDGYFRDTKNQLCIKYNSTKGNNIVVGYYDEKNVIQPLTPKLVEYCNKNRLPYEPLINKPEPEKKEEPKNGPVIPFHTETFRYPVDVTVIKMIDGNYMESEHRLTLTPCDGYCGRTVFGYYDNDYVIRPLTAEKVEICRRLGFEPSFVGESKDTMIEL